MFGRIQAGVGGEWETRSIFSYHHDHRTLGSLGDSPITVGPLATLIGDP